MHDRVKTLMANKYMKTLLATNHSEIKLQLPAAVGVGTIKSCTCVEQLNCSYRAVWKEK